MSISKAKINTNTKVKPKAKKVQSEPMANAKTQNKPKTKAKSKSEFDTPWKKILDRFFQDFMAYCWPKYYDQIDWSKGYKSLDKELSRLSRDVPIGNRVVDKLIEVYLKSGEDACIFIHLEVQGQSEEIFNERMFIYRCRLRSSYRNPIVSLAILIDKDETWRPGVYREELWGSSMEMKFPILKILDYKPRIAELKASNNKFAPVILAQLIALEKQSSEAKLISTIALVKHLFRKGWEKADISDLLTFIEWVIALPPDLEVKYQEQVRVLEEEENVQYVTSFERVGIERGIKIGIEQGIEQGMEQGIGQGVQLGGASVLLKLIEAKFKTVPASCVKKINSADTKTINQWAVNVIKAESIEEIF